MSTLASVFGYGLLSARAAASVAGRFYYATDTTLMYRDNGATWDALAVGTGSMATDGLWDSAGDLAQGTGANTGAKLPLGAAGTVVRSTGATNAYAFPPGYEFDYVAITAPVNITATAEASATTLITGNAVTYDGSTVIDVEGYSPEVNNGGDTFVILDLFEGATQLGRIARFDGASGGQIPMRGSLRITPSAGAHTYTLKGWGNAGGGFLGAGAGGSAAYVPAWLRIRKV